MSRITDDELLAFLDELLAGVRAVEIERELRDSAALRQRAALLSRRRDQGGHSIGEIWRRHQVSCPSRDELSQYANGQLLAPARAIIEFHIQEAACAICAANLADLTRTAPVDEDQTRRKRFFESSAGGLKDVSGSDG